MRSFSAWITRQFQKLLLLPDYFRALAREWLNILFGETLVGIAFLLWWALANPPNPRLILAFIAAMFVAGYYAWRAEHIRLVPKFTIREAKIQPTETESPTEMNMFIQIIPTCLTEAPVIECRGRLLRVCHRRGNDDE
jgi:predicted membrane metal-binding protein